jgi:hypothetical protein
MNSNRQTTTPVASYRTTAIVAGVCYLITHVTSIGAVILYNPVLNDSHFITTSGSSTGVLLGAFLEIILAFGNIGTAVTLFPVVKRYNEGVALGYVALRTLESAIIVVGIMPLLVIVTLKQHLTGDTASLTTMGNALVAFHNWTFLLGPSFVSGTNTVFMAYLMYQSRLVPRFIPILGLLGGPLVFLSATSVLFGLFGQYSSLTALIALPEFAWELSLAIRLVGWGFRPAALTSTPVSIEANERTLA